MTNQLEEAMAALAVDLDSRLENIEAIKGKTFAQAVQLAVNQHTIMKIAVSDMPAMLRELIIPDMCAMHLVSCAKALGLDKEQCIEMANLAKGIAEQINNEARRLLPLIDKEVGEG